MGKADEGAKLGGRGCPEIRTDLLGGGPFGHAVQVRDIGHNPPHWEGVGQITPQGILQDEGGGNLCDEGTKYGYNPPMEAAMAEAELQEVETYVSL